VCSSDLRKPTPQVQEQRNALESEYMKYEKQNEEYFNYVLLGKSHSRFFRRKEQILEDANYALARAISMMNTAHESEAIQESKEKTGEIDSEIEKLKQELNELE